MAPPVADTKPADAPPRQAAPPKEQPPRESDWLAAAEGMLRHARQNPRPVDPVRPAGLTDDEYGVAKARADRTLDECRWAVRRGCETEQDGCAVFDAMNGLGTIGDVYPHAERVLIREAMRACSGLGKADVETRLAGNPLYRVLLDRQAVAAVGTRPPPRDRRRWYEEFATAAGIDRGWSLLVPFEDLTPDVMAELPAVAGRVQAQGLGGVTHDERAALLAAGAADFFERHLRAAQGRAVRGSPGK